MERHNELKAFDSQYKGIMAGIDEAGRGPWAGPVVVAAVILDKTKLDNLLGVDDSKKLNVKKREKLFELIVDSSISYSITEVSNKVVDRDGILKATMQGAVASVIKLNKIPDIVLIDGTIAPEIKDVKVEAIKDGDARSLSIAAASILAKVHRDRIMGNYDRFWPDYGFAKHKGYGTKEHAEALKKLGVCDIHRRSYKPVKAFLEGQGIEQEANRQDP